MTTYYITREQLKRKAFKEAAKPIKTEEKTPNFEIFRPVLLDHLREMVTADRQAG